MEHWDVWKCFHLLQLPGQGHCWYLVNGDQKEGYLTPFHTQGSLCTHSECQLWLKILLWLHQKNASLPPSQWDTQSLSLVATVSHGQYCGNRHAPGLLRTVSHGCRRHAVFFSRLFTPTAFDSFSHLTFNFIKFIQEWHDQYWYILHLDHPGFCLFWWYWGWNPGLAHVRQAVYRWVPCIPTPPLG